MVPKVNSATHLCFHPVANKFSRVLGSRKCLAATSRQHESLTPVYREVTYLASADQSGQDCDFAVPFPEFYGERLRQDRSRVSL